MDKKDGWNETGINLIGLRQARCAAGMQQQELAKRVGLTSGAISQFELRRNGARELTITKLVKVLNVSRDELVNGVLAKNETEEMSDKFASVFLQDNHINVWAINDTPEDALFHAARDFQELVQEETDRKRQHDQRLMFYSGLHTFPLTAKALTHCQTGNAPEVLELRRNVIIAQGE